MRRRIRWRQLRRRPGTTSTLFLLGGVLALGVVGLAAVRVSAERAVGDSLRADLGGRTYALQTGDPTVAAVLAGIDGASPVADDAGAVSDPARRLRIDAALRFTDDPALALGVLVHGARPARPGEALFSESTAEALELRIGGRATVYASRGELDVTVTGLTVDPANTSTRTAVVLLGPDADLGATRWLSDAPFYHEVVALQRPLEERRASLGGAAGLLEGAAAAQPQFVSALRRLPLGAGLAVAVVILAFASMRARRWSADVETLVAAGMAYGPAWRIVLDGAVLAVAAGLLSGTVLALGLLARFRVEVSSWFGQRWVTLEIPWFALLALVLTAGGAVLLVRFPPRAAWSGLRGVVRRPAGPRRQQGRAAWAVLALALAAWSVLLASAGSQAVEGALALLPVLPSTACDAAAALPFAVAPLLEIGLGPSLRAVSRDVANGLAVIVAAAAVVALLTGIWSAQRYGEARSGEVLSSPMQPAGSFVIDRVPDGDLNALQRLYRSAGGRELASWRLPDESRVQLRATSPTLVACLTESGADRPDNLPESCWPPDAASPVSPAMLGAAGSRDVADPDLIENGRIGFMQFTAGTSDVARSGTAVAAADPTLGGLVPGLVVDPDGELARTYGLRPSGMSEVALIDFSGLDPETRLRVRAEVARLAPGAQTADGTDPTAYDRLRSTADLAAILGGAAAFVLLMLGLSATVTAHTPTRRLLVELGGTPRLRLVLVARWLAMPVVVAAFTAAITVLTASYGLRGPIGNLGLAWAVPSALVLAATLVAVPGFLRVPVERAE
jgi:hypothetical protein